MSLCRSFKCGIDYHAPTDCDTIKKWLTKCADDSETANYISAHTKDVSNAMIFSDTIYTSINAMSFIVMSETLH